MTITLYLFVAFVGAVGNDLENLSVIVNEAYDCQRLQITWFM